MNDPKPGSKKGEVEGLRKVKLLVILEAGLRQ